MGPVQSWWRLVLWLVFWQWIFRFDRTLCCEESWQKCKVTTIFLFLSYFFLCSQRYRARSLLAVQKSTEGIVLPPEDVAAEIVRIFHTPGLIPEDSELMRCICRPKMFPSDVTGWYDFLFLLYMMFIVGNLFLKKRIFREADSNSKTSTGELAPLSSLVRRIFATTVFPNMVRTGHWIETNDKGKLFFINLIGDIQVSRVIRHVLMRHDEDVGARENKIFIFSKSSGNWASVRRQGCGAHALSRRFPCVWHVYQIIFD